MRGSLIVILLAVLGAALIVGFTIFRPEEPGRPMTRAPEASAAGPARPLPPPVELASPPPAPSAETAALPPSGAASEAEQAAVQPPRFDVVRISRNCTAVLAGRAQPGVLVTIKAGEQEVGRVTADSRGEWVLVPDLPLESGTRELSLAGSMPGQPPVVSPEVVVVVVPSCAPGQPDPGEQAIAVLTPRQGSSRLMQVPTPEGDVARAKGLSLDTVDYDDRGNLVLSGRAEPGTMVQAYLNNQPAGTGTADPKGLWDIEMATRVDPGIYTLRVDQVEESGKVQARVEMPFSRADPADITLNGGQVVVQPGNSLWRIARRAYGEGTQYTVIYRANREQIGDPDRIYPGQIFTLPESAAGQHDSQTN